MTRAQGNPGAVQAQIRHDEGVRAAATRRASPTGLTRPGAGVDIDPARLTRIRENRGMRPADLAARVTAIYADAYAFAGLAGLAAAGDKAAIKKMKAGQPDLLPGTVRLLCSILECQPGDLHPAVLAVTRQFHGQPLDALEAQIDAAVTNAAGQPLTMARITVEKHETGERRPKARTLAAECAALDCDPEDLRDPGPLEDAELAAEVRRAVTEAREVREAAAEAAREAAAGAVAG